MRSEWPRKHLAEISEVITGFPFKGEKYLPPKHGVRVVRGDNVTERYLRWGEKEKCWSGVTADLKPYVLRSGDVVIGMDGSKVGKNFAAISPDDEGSLLAQRVARLRAREGISQDYLRYVICNDSFTEYVKAVHTGTSIPHLSKGQIENFEVVVPPFEDQQQIAAVLISLDDRITLLRETNATLEAIAQALFKSWFVDFDPVRAKMEGRTPEGMDEATAALFPDGFETSELGEVPRGWRVGKVGEVAEVVKGKSYSSKDLVDSHHTALVTLKSFERGGGFRMDGFKPYSGAYKPSQVVSAGDLIVAYTDVTQAAELIGKPAVVVGVDEYTTLVASLDVGIVRPDERHCGKQFLYGLFRTDAFQSHTLAHTSGTTVLHLAKDGIGSFAFALPPNELIRSFEVIAATIASRKQTNSDAVRTLSTLRDTLLPRLISGQLRLPEAQAATEAALGGTLSV